VYRLFFLAMLGTFPEGKPSFSVSKETGEAHGFGHLRKSEQISLEWLTTMACRF